MMKLNVISMLKLVSMQVCLYLQKKGSIAKKKSAVNDHCLLSGHTYSFDKCTVLHYDLLNLNV